MRPRLLLSLVLWLLSLVCVSGCAAPLSRQVVLVAAGITRGVDQAAAAIYTHAAEAARADQQLLQLAGSGPDGPQKALAAYRERMRPYEALRQGVNLARGAELAAGAAVDAAGRGADKTLSAVTSAAYAVGATADLVGLLGAAGVPVPDYLRSAVYGGCDTVRRLLAQLAPTLPAPCGASSR